MEAYNPGRIVFSGLILKVFGNKMFIVCSWCIYYAFTVQKFTGTSENKYIDAISLWINSTLICFIVYIFIYLFIVHLYIINKVIFNDNFTFLIPFLIYKKHQSFLGLLKHLQHIYCSLMYLL